VKIYIFNSFKYNLLFCCIIFKQSTAILTRNLIVRHAAVIRVYNNTLLKYCTKLQQYIHCHQTYKVVKLQLSVKIRWIENTLAASVLNKTRLALLIPISNASR